MLRFQPLLLCLAVSCAGLLRAAETPAATEAPPKSREEAYQRAGIKLKSGPATVALGSAAEIKLPEGYHFIGPDSLDRFYELTQNSRAGNEVGVMLAKDYMLFFDYADIGYVKDEDKDQLDADKLMSAMKEGEEESNAARKERGWDELRLAGWSTKPHYDAKTNNLKWAINLTSSQDNYKEVWINESIRLLGRGGVMNVTLVSDTAAFKQAEVDADKLLAENFGYVAGQKYAEFKSGDKIAAYGLSALVLGGAGVAASKMGLFAKLGVMLGKAWKFVVLAIVALGAAIKKFWDRIVGAKAPPPPAA